MKIPDEIIFKAQEAHMNELYHGRISTDDDDSTKSYRAQVKGFEVIAEWMREKAAQLHENINPQSDHERLRGIPGSDAMGAIIRYRDEIRKFGEPPAPSESGRGKA